MQTHFLTFRKALLAAAAGANTTCHVLSTIASLSYRHCCWVTGQGTKCQEGKSQLPLYDQKLPLPSLTAEVGPSHFGWQSSTCRDASTPVPPRANKKHCWQLRETHTHIKGALQGAPLCTGTVQELGRSRERKGNRLGKAAARLGKEQEYLRDNC